jgi:hypothetical protein
MPNNNSIKNALVAAFVAALVGWGVSTIVAQQIAGSMKLCYQVSTIDGTATKDYILANPCPPGWTESQQ